MYHQNHRYILKKFLKISAISGFILFLAAFIFYHSNNTRRKSVAKTRVLHFLNLVDSDWEKETTNKLMTVTTPTMVVDGVFKSMEGPVVYEFFAVNPDKEELIWLNSFSTKAMNLDNEQISNDFVCHTNVDFMFIEHYGKWGLNESLYRNYPRLTSMSNGMTSYSFPEGFGFPIFSNERIQFQTQVLNHNIKDTLFRMKHRLEIGYTEHTPEMKPLISRPVYIQLPFSEDFKKQHPAMLDPNQCIPVDKGIHEIDAKTGQKVSGFWVIPKGKSEYSYNVNHQIGVKDSLSLHMIVPHVHPFAERIHFIDKTTNKTLYTCDIENSTGKIGLEYTPIWKSKEGIMIYADHDYELKIEINNTSGILQDMMGSLFLFFHDKGMSEKLKTYNPTKL